MTSKIKQALIGGIIGTAVMTVTMMVCHMIGMPKMSPPEMLSTMMGFSIGIGWLMHFMIGIVFAMAYAFIFINLVKKVGTVHSRRLCRWR